MGGWEEEPVAEEGSEDELPPHVHKVNHGAWHDIHKMAYRAGHLSAHFNVVSGRSSTVIPRFTIRGPSVSRKFLVERIKFPSAEIC